MSSRLRVSLVVLGAALAAAAAVVGVTLAQTNGEQRGTIGVTTPQKGAPPLLIDLGLRVDPQAAALRRALTLYSDGRRAAAAAIFERYPSLDAQLGAAYASWPDGSLERVQELAAAHPHSSTALLHLGVADYWAGRVADAQASWKRAAAAEPDTQAAVDAGDFLHPSFFHGLPPFVPETGLPPALAKLAPPRQFAALARLARGDDVRAKLLYGVALQRLGRPVSAERAFAAAAKAAPHDAEAQVAAAVGRFTKAHPERAFSRLGPLAKVFPHAPTVRFHLGLMLLWMGEAKQGELELRRARAEAPASPLGREAAAFLARLGKGGTK